MGAPFIAEGAHISRLPLPTWREQETLCDLYRSRKDHFRVHRDFVFS